MRVNREVRTARSGGARDSPAAGRRGGIGQARSRLGVRQGRAYLELRDFRRQFCLPWLVRSRHIVASGDPGEVRGDPFASDRGIDGPGKGHDCVPRFVVSVRVGLQFLGREGVNVRGQATASSSSGRRPHELPGVIDGRQHRESAEHVVNFLQESRAFARQIIGGNSQVAHAGRGVAHLTLPVDVVSAKTEGGVSSLATLKPLSERVASDADIAEMARRIDQAGRIVIKTTHPKVKELVLSVRFSVER